MQTTNEWKRTKQQSDKKQDTKDRSQCGHALRLDLMAVRGV